VNAVTLERDRSEPCRGAGQGDVERPSDVDGVVHISSDGGNWKMDLAREIKAAG